MLTLEWELIVSWYFATLVVVHGVLREQRTALTGSSMHILHIHERSMHVKENGQIVEKREAKKKICKKPATTHNHYIVAAATTAV